MGAVIWFTGRPASGKSTLAENVRTELVRRGMPCCILDGDAVRSALVPKPGYDAKARADFYASLANLAALLARQGFLVLVPATAHLREFRAHARAVAPSFVEVWVNVPEATLRARDPKGLYKASDEGRVHELPGVDLGYEEPTAADVIASGGRDETAVRALLGLLASRGQ